MQTAELNVECARGRGADQNRSRRVWPSVLTEIEWDRSAIQPLWPCVKIRCPFQYAWRKNTALFNWPWTIGGLLLELKLNSDTFTVSQSVTQTGYKFQARKWKIVELLNLLDKFFVFKVHNSVPEIWNTPTTNLQAFSSTFQKLCFRIDKAHWD